VVGLPLRFAGAVVSLWYAAAGIVPDRKAILVARPHELWAHALAREEIREDLWVGLINTTKVSLTALVIAIAVGVLTAVVMSQRPVFERALSPWAVVLQTIPTLALVPLIGIWFGYGFRGRVLVAVLIALFPIITNTLFGLHSAEPAQHDLFRLHKASMLTRLFRLQFPAGLPAILTGFRISAGLSVIGAIVGEFFFGRGEKGLGNLIDRYRGILEVESLYTTIILSSILGILIFWGFTLLMRAVVGSWHESVITNE
jgi:NitT/TauT family transport system permease protein